MGSKDIEPSELGTLDNTFPEVLEDTEGSAGTFKKVVARAEELGELAKQAAESSIRASQEAISRAEEVSKRAEQAAETAARASGQAVDRAEAVS